MPPERFVFEPDDCFVKAHAVLDKGQDHVLDVGVNLLLASAMKLIAALQQKQIHHEQCSTLVAVNEPVIGRQRLDHSGLLGD